MSNANRLASVRLAIAAGTVLALFVTFVACGGCGRRSAGGAPMAAAQASASAAGDGPYRAIDASPLHDPLLWSNAKDGDAEDLSTLADHEGAAGLVEATRDAALRATAIRAMGYARGWAQLPFLAKTASGKDDEEARLALESTIELAARPRVSEDPEDAEELREGCETLAALARDTKGQRGRRVSAVRALRMMPCPKSELPADVDAK